MHMGTCILLDVITSYIGELFVISSIGEVFANMINK